MCYSWVEKGGCMKYLVLVLALVTLLPNSGFSQGRPTAIPEPACLYGMWTQSTIVRSQSHSDKHFYILPVIEFGEVKSVTKKDDYYVVVYPFFADFEEGTIEDLQVRVGNEIGVNPKEIVFEYYDDVGIVRNSLTRSLGSFSQHTSKNDDNEWTFTLFIHEKQTDLMFEGQRYDLSFEIYDKGNHWDIGDECWPVEVIRSLPPLYEDDLPK